MESINFTSIFFYGFATLTLVSAVYAVLFTNNVVRAAFALMATFAGIAGLFGVLGADFLMAAQLIVYVGGILILILFGVMMSPRATVAELPGSRPTVMAWLGIGTVGSLLLFAFSQVFLGTEWNCINEGCMATVPIPAGIGNTISGTTRTIGELFLTKYLLPFEFISVLLLAALVGAVILARKEIR